MSAIINYIADEAKQTFNDVKTGQCFQNFTQVSGKRQLQIITKVAAVAFLVGLIASMLCPVLGVILGLVAGFAAFAYLTNNNQTADNFAIDLISQVRAGLNSGGIPAHMMHGLSSFAA